MAGLPQNQRDQLLLIVCVAALGLAYVYYQYLWTPRQADLATISAHVDSLHARNESARREIARGTIPKLRAEAEQYGRMLGLMRQLVPVANEVPTLLDQISSAARASGLDLSDVTPLGVIPGQVFDTYRYKLAVTGPYHRVGTFLNNIGSLTRIVAPMNLSLTPSGRTARDARPGEQLLEASFEIQTFVAKTAPPALDGPGGRGP